MNSKAGLLNVGYLMATSRHAELPSQSAEAELADRVELSTPAVAPCVEGALRIRRLWAGRLWAGREAVGREAVAPLNKCTSE